MMPSGFLRRAILLGLLLCLVACAHVPGPEGQMREARQVQDWQLAGRFVAGQRSVSGAEADAPDPVAGRFSWLHRPDSDQLWLIGPVGNTLAKVDLLPTGITWQDAMGKRGAASSLQALGESLAGIRLPDVPANSWLRGQWPAAAVQATDAAGRVAVAVARGWRFEYRYGEPAPNGWPLAIEGAGPDGIWVRVALTEWDGETDPALAVRP